MNESLGSPSTRSNSGSIQRSDTNISQSTTYEYEDENDIPIIRNMTQGTTYNYDEEDEYNMSDNEDNDINDNNNDNKGNTNVFANSILNSAALSFINQQAPSAPHPPPSSSDTMGVMYAKAHQKFLHDNLQGTNESAVRLRNIIEAHTTSSTHADHTHHKHTLSTTNSLAQLQSTELTSEAFYTVLSDLPTETVTDYEIIYSSADKLNGLSGGTVTLWIKYKHYPLELKFRTNPVTGYLRLAMVNCVRNINPSLLDQTTLQSSNNNSSSSTTLVRSSSPQNMDMGTDNTTLLPPSQEYEIAFYWHIQRMIELLSLANPAALIKDLLERFTYRSEALNKLKQQETIMERSNSSNQQDVVQFLDSTLINKVLSAKYPAARKILIGIQLAYQMLFTHCFVCGRMLPDIKSATPLTLKHRIYTTSTCGNDLCRHAETMSTRYVDMFTESRNTSFLFHYDFIVQASYRALQSNQRDSLMHPVPDAYVSTSSTINVKTIDYDSLTTDILFLLNHSRGEHITACTSNAAIRLYFMTLTLRQARVPGYLIIQAITELSASNEDPLTKLPNLKDEYDTSKESFVNNHVDYTTIKFDKLYLLAWWLLRSLPLRFVTCTADQLPLLVRRDYTFSPYVSKAQIDKDNTIVNFSPISVSSTTADKINCPYTFHRIYTQSGLPGYISIAHNGDSRTVLPAIMEEENEAERLMIDYIPKSPNKINYPTISGKNGIPSFTPVQQVVTVFHGSQLQTWLSILRIGLVSLSNTAHMRNAAAYGAGTYFAPIASTSISYCQIGTWILPIIPTLDPLVPRWYKGKGSNQGTVTMTTTTTNDKWNNNNDARNNGSLIMNRGTNIVNFHNNTTDKWNNNNNTKATTLTIEETNDESKYSLPVELNPILYPVSITPITYYALGIAHVDGRPTMTASTKNVQTTSVATSTTTTSSSTTTTSVVSSIFSSLLNNNTNTATVNTITYSKNCDDYPVRDFGYCITSTEDHRNRLLYLVFPKK